VTTRAWRIAHLVLVAVVAATVALTGCGPSSTAGSGAAGTSASSSAATAGASTSSQGASNCPTQNTRAFAKTRLVADLGLTVGTFHRYIYKPFKAGAFEKGAHGRLLALVKAAATAAVDVKLLSNAAENIKANPTLCNLLYQPMTDLEGRLAALKGEVSVGNIASIGSIEPVVSGLLTKATSNGLPVTETTNSAGTP
jgi:hypothetical protein